MRSSRIAVLLVFITMIISGGASQQWEITDLDAPQSLDNVSEGQTTMQVVRLRNDTGGLVDEQELSSTDWTLEFQPGDGGSYQQMEFADEGFWFAEFETEEKINLTYRLRDTSASSDSIEKYENITPGNLSIEIEDGLKDRYDPGSERTFRINVTEPDNSTVTNAQAFLTFAGTTHNKTVELGYNNGLYTNVAEIPTTYNTTMVLHFNATGGSSIRPYGSTSRSVETYPEKLGEIDYINSSTEYCSSDTFPSSCERDANISTGFNVTVFSASRGDLELWLREDSGSLSMHDEVSMEKSGGLWRADFDYPDINTSSYQKELVMRYNLTIDGELFTLNETIDYDSFKVQDRSNPTAFQGSDYTVRMAVLKPFSNLAVNSSRAEAADVNISDPDNNITWELDLSDFEYNSEKGLFQHDIFIPSDEDTGTYSLDMMVENLYSEQMTATSGFDLESRDASFNTSGDVVTIYDRLGNYSTNITVTNRVQRNLFLDWEVDGDLEDHLQIGNGSHVELGQDETMNVTLEADIETLEDMEGEFTLTDNKTDYNRTYDYEFNHPPCEVLNSTLCLNNSETSVTADESRVYSSIVNVEYLGEDSGASITADITGNISDLVTVDPGVFFLAGDRDVNVTMTPDALGYYEGEIRFDDGDGFAAHGLEFDVDTIISRPDVEIESNLDLGTLDSGESTTATLEVNNTGNVEISSVEASSLDYEVTASMDSTSAGEVGDVTIDFTSVDTETGQVELTFTTGGEDVVRTVFVEATVSSTGTGSDYGQKINDAETRLSNLDRRASDPSILQEIRSLRTNLSRTETLYDSGSTEEADASYEALMDEIDSLDQEISNNQDSGTGSGPDNNDTDPGGTEPPSSEQGGGLPIVPIIVVVLVLGVAGFIFYTSYIPEEGDPLYDLLGEE